MCYRINGTLNSRSFNNKTIVGKLLCCVVVWVLFTVFFFLYSFVLRHLVIAVSVTLACTTGAFGDVQAGFGARARSTSNERLAPQNPPPSKLEAAIVQVTATPRNC